VCLLRSLSSVSCQLAFVQSTWLASSNQFIHLHVISQCVHYSHKWFQQWLSQFSYGIRNRIRFLRVLENSIKSIVSEKASNILETLVKYIKLLVREVFVILRKNIIKVVQDAYLHRGIRRRCALCGWWISSVCGWTCAHVIMLPRQVLCNTHPQIFFSNSSILYFILDKISFTLKLTLDSLGNEEKEYKFQIRVGF